ncbi:PREDICTED: uncharacterized protein LOC105557050 [Vollenhovia emeryi]|uniref:uncharacterized protein LOC105557050 n=1 Tax=Vollenhovia emeryi TaxID=411798 RepID=UPI0005F3D4FC|nr:PREDICTED: uncharacterized protein LOC105557050 [Vollenhovia emeryi]
MAERGCGLGIVVEPLTVPDHPCWMGSRDNSVAIFWRRTGEEYTPCVRGSSGEGWVTVKWGPITVMGVYIRPSLTRAELEDRLDEMERQVRRLLPGPVMIAGDFNAASTLWGSRRQNAKGAEVVAWANRLGLHLENRGNTSTCVRPQGESIVDLTWTSPGATRMISSWRVAVELEILSDHLPIIIELKLSDETGRDAHQRPPRWAIRKMDPDKLRASLIAEEWSGEERENVEEQALWLRHDQSMRRSHAEGCLCASKGGVLVVGGGGSAKKSGSPGKKTLAAHTTKEG